MRVANVSDRALLLTSNHTGVDIATASQGKFGPSLPELYQNWDDFHAWAAGFDPAGDTELVSFERSELGAPTPAPRQIFAIGLNYAEHANESGFAVTEAGPPVFTKFVSSLSGPDTTVKLPPEGHTDWEVELAVIIGRGGDSIRAEQAFEHVAGLCVAQDLSERISQLAGSAPQFSLGKSFPGFLPLGPWLVSPEELKDPNDLELGARLDGEVVQQGRTRDLIYSVSALIERLSHNITFYPGDLILSGTPSGVGLGRKPQRYIQPGERLESWIEGIGELHQNFVA